MNTTNISDFKSAVQMLWSDGLYDQARKMEEDAKKKGMHIGSCYTEAILDRLITSDERMIELKDDVRALEFINDPVLIRGETGTGKELIAQALHGSRGPSKDEPNAGKFIAVNCPALSVDLMLSEFFGHVKGAFTGAVSDRAGKFQAAYKGTIFIDEVGDMPSSMQAALLRVLQEGVITRVGSNDEVEVNARVVCATNKSLELMVDEGAFRLDLLQRINTFELRTTPLRERPNDIAKIIAHWESLDKARGEKFPLEKIANYDFKGNIRELQGVYRRWRILKKL